MGYKMKFLKKASEAAKAMPKAVWVAAVIIPGGFIAIGTYLVVKGMKKPVKEKTLKETLEEWKKDD